MEKCIDSPKSIITSQNKIQKLNDQILQVKKGLSRKISKLTSTFRYFSCKINSHRRIKAKEVFIEKDVYNSLSIIKKYITSNDLNFKYNHFIHKLFQFNKLYKLRKKGTFRKKILFDTNLLVSIIESDRNKSPTIKEISHKYKELSNFHNFSNSSLTSWLKEQLNYKFQNNNLINFRKNSFETQVMMFEFLNIVADLLSQDSIILSCDEASFAEKKVRLKGWQSDNYSAPRETGGRSASVSVIAAIDRDKLLMWHLNKSANTSQDFIDFIKDLEDQLSAIPEYKEKLKKQKVYLLLDNAGIHTGKESRKALLSSKLRFVFIPVYSPHIQPIELLWGKLKKKMSRKVFKNM